MQDLINEYFSKICSDKFFKNDEEVIIGKAKDVIENLKQQSEYVKNSENNIDKENIEFITNEIKILIKEIQDTYLNDNDIIKIELNPMAGFYLLSEQDRLLEELKQYYDELEEN